MRIILSGGGTIGSVGPLLAVAEKFKEKDQDVQFLWLGTKDGPEKKLLEGRQIEFQPIYSGKLRRYFNWRNFISPFFILFGFIQSFFILLKFRPAIILTAGSFVSVPVIWAAWLLKIPSVVHQQDMKVGLANKLMVPFASRITVAFEEFLKYFPADKAMWTGNPVREELRIRNHESGIEEATEFFQLEKNLPVVLVVGGGTGALELNKIIVQTLPALLRFCQVIHLTGANKTFNPPAGQAGFQLFPPKRDPAEAVATFNSGRYHPYEFLIEEMKLAYAAADLAVSRAGMGALTELAALAKPAIIVPMPDSHQEENAKFFADCQSVIVLPQNNLTPEILTRKIKELLDNKEKLEELSRNISKLTKPNAAEIIVEEVLKLLQKHL